jgi:hypothetical protein
MTAGATMPYASLASRRSAPRGSAPGNGASAETNAIEQLLHLRGGPGEGGPGLHLPAERAVQVDLEYLGELGIDRSHRPGHGGLDDLSRLRRRNCQRIGERGIVEEAPPRAR